MTAPWQGSAMPTIEDMCPCESMPIIIWKRGKVLLVRDMEDADPLADAEEYSAGGWQELVHLLSRVRQGLPGRGDDMSKLVDHRHALYAGWVIGIARANGLPVRPVLDDDGNYTDEIEFRVRNSDVGLVVIVPPPPEDWTLPA